MKHIVSVVGSSDSTQQEDLHAYELGVQLSAAGHVILCGGRGGIMEAVAKGAAENDGFCVGLLPGDDRKGANPYISIAIPTGLGHARNILIARACDIMIAIGGSYGTLSEIAIALTMGKAVIGLSTWRAISNDEKAMDIIEVSSPAEAVKKVNEVLSKTS